MRDDRWFSLSLAAAVLVAVVFAWMHRWNGEDGNGWEALIDGDSKGYYANLPAVFIYHDLSFSFFNKPENSSIARYYNPRFRVKTEQGEVNKNYAGTALLLTPFFLAGHLTAMATGEPETGFSAPYFFFTLAGAIFYFFVGLLLSGRLLKSYGIGNFATATSMLLIGIATNLLYYTSIHAAMAHVYSFAGIAAFCFYARRYIIRPGNRDLLFAAFALGVVILVRPVNAVVVAALPLLAGAPENLKYLVQHLFRSPKILVVAALIVISIPAIQNLLYFFQTAHFWVWSYGDEGFIFSDPRFGKVLFSFRKGLFVYTPVLWLMLPGLFVMFRKSRFMVMAWMFFFLLVLYFVSSWWNWYFGDGYGSRSFIDFYPLLFIPVAFLLDRSRNRMRFTLAVVSLAFIVLGLVQTYQYRYQIIHPSAMNREKYLYVFLKTGNEFRDVLGGDMQTVYGRIEKAPLVFKKEDFEIGDAGVTVPGHKPFSGTHVATLDSSIEFGPGLEIGLPEIKRDAHPLYLMAEVRRLELETGACTEAYLVCIISDTTGRQYHYSAHRMADLPRKVTGTWMASRAGLLLPPEAAYRDRILCYIWNKGRKRFMVDDLQAGLHTVTPYR
jgi:hypothetical protein